MTMAANKGTKNEPRSAATAAAAAAAATATAAVKSSESSAAVATTPTAKKMVPRKELPSISHMLVHGAPESQGRPKTWTELVGFPLVLLILFIISFYLFLNSPPSRYPRGRYTLPQNKKPVQNKMPVQVMIKEALSQHQKDSETPKTELNADPAKEEF